MDAGEELDVRACRVSRALADPQQVGRAVVPVAGEAVAPAEGLLVGQDEALVARIQVHLVQLVLAVEVDAAGGHEAQGVVDAAGDLLVAAPLGGAGDELLVPQVDLREVGEPALGEGAQEIEPRGGLVVGLQHARRVGHSRGGVGESSFTMWPRNEGSSTPSTTSVGLERGLANCPAARASLTTGSAAP